MANISAGLLMYRKREGETEVFLAHPGGPFWAKKDEGAWSIPKGVSHDGEDLLETAKREFEEETGKKPEGEFQYLTKVKRPGKEVEVWMFEGDLDLKDFRSNLTKFGWPENDRAGFFSLEEAERKMVPYQRPLLDFLR